MKKLGSIKIKNSLLVQAEATSLLKPLFEIFIPYAIDKDSDPRYSIYMGHCAAFEEIREEDPIPEYDINVQLAEGRYQITNIQRKSARYNGPLPEYIQAIRSKDREEYYNNAIATQKEMQRKLETLAPANTVSTTTWTPKPGEWIEVRDHKNTHWQQRIFIGQSNDENYPFKTVANDYEKEYQNKGPYITLKWRFARPLNIISHAK